MEPLRTPLQHSPGEGCLFTADADVSPTKEEVRSMKRKHTFALRFAEDIESQTGLRLLPGPDRNGRAVSQCGTYLCVFVSWSLILCVCVCVLPLS